MDIFEGENSRYRKQLTKLGGNKVLRSRPRAAMFAVSFANFKSCALSCDPSPRAEVRARAQATHGNISVLSHLNKTLTNVYDRVTVYRTNNYDE